MAAAASTSSSKLIADLPYNVQQTIIGHVERKGLIQLLRVSSHYHALASERIYGCLRFILVPTHRGSEQKARRYCLVEALQTLATSDYDYARHVTRFSVEPSVLGSDPHQRILAEQYHHKDDACGFLNVLLLLFFKRAKSLEILRWAVAIELSASVYNALSRIASLSCVWIHLDTHVSTNAPATHAVPPPPPPGGVTGGNAVPPAPSTWANPISSQSSPPKNPTSATKGKALGDFDSTGGPCRKISAFGHVRTLELHGIDNLACTNEIATCIGSSSSTLKSLTLSLSKDLAGQAKKRPESSQTAAYTQQWEDGDDATELEFSGTPASQSAAAPSAEDVKKLRNAMSMFLAKVFGLEPADSGSRIVDKTLQTASVAVVNRSTEELMYLAQWKSDLARKVKQLNESSKSEGQIVEERDRIRMLRFLIKVADHYIQSKKQSALSVAQKPKQSHHKKAKKTVSAGPHPISGYPQYQQWSTSAGPVTSQSFEQLGTTLGTSLSDDYAGLDSETIMNYMSSHGLPMHTPSGQPYFLYSNGNSPHYNDSSTPGDMLYSAVFGGPGPVAYASSGQSQGGPSSNMPPPAEILKFVKQKKEMMYKEKAAILKGQKKGHSTGTSAKQKVSKTGLHESSYSDKASEVFDLPPPPEQSKIADIEEELEFDIDMEHPDILSENDDNDAEDDYEVEDEAEDGSQDGNEDGNVEAHFEIDETSEVNDEENDANNTYGNSSGDGSYTPPGDLANNYTAAMESSHADSSHIISQEDADAIERALESPFEEVPPSSNLGAEQIPISTWYTDADKEADTTSAEQTMQQYLLKTHGLTIEHLTLYFIPVKPSVFGRALDLSRLKSLSLLSVGPQGALWTLMSKHLQEGLDLQLRSIQTDDVSLAFLHFVEKLPVIHILHMLKRNATEYDCTTVKPPASLEEIRTFALRKHAKHLVRLSIVNNNNANVWELDRKCVKLLAALGTNLRELAFGINQDNFHDFIRALPGFKSLEALHIVRGPYANTPNQFYSAYGPREMRRSILDVLELVPGMKIRIVAIANQLHRVRVWDPRPPKPLKPRVAADVKGKGKAPAVDMSGVTDGAIGAVDEELEYSDIENEVSLSAISGFPKFADLEAEYPIFGQTVRTGRV